MVSLRLQFSTLEEMNTPPIDFFWGEKGLFSAQYAEENHFLFPSLKVVVEGIGEEKIFEGLELTADDWEEIEEYEYAFV